MKRQRNTPQRQLILNAVKARCDHPGADQIYHDVRTVNNKISRGTVYRNLYFLAQQGEIHQVKLPHMDRFEDRLDKHYHIRCTECGALCDVPMDYISELDDQVKEKTGFTVEGHSVTFEGLCPDCQQRQTQSQK